MDRFARRVGLRVSMLTGAFLCLALACNTPSPGPSPPPPLPEDMPEDFYAKSEFIGAPVTPAYHYDYYIVLDRTVTDTISFHPDYLDSDPPVWAETFDATDDSLESLYDRMRGNDIFRDFWDPASDTLVGASRRSLEVIASNRSFYVPVLVEDTAAVNPVYRAIDSLVPGEVWDTLWSRRDRYIEDHP